MGHMQLKNLQNLPKNLYIIIYNLFLPPDIKG